MTDADYQLKPVLALFRTSSPVYEWHKANRYGDSVNEGAQQLEELPHQLAPELVLPYVEKAIASTVRVILRADDSSGIIGMGIDHLLDLHARLCNLSPPKTAKLVAWLIKFQFDGIQDYFQIDIVDYAKALGDKGVAKYRAELEKINVERSDHDNSFALEYNFKRLAVVNRDVDQIVELYGGDQSRAFRLQDLAGALVEIDEIALAIEFAQKGAFLDRGFQSESCAQYWCDLLRNFRPAEELAARSSVFDLWPNAKNASGLYQAAAESWPQIQTQILTTLGTSPRECVSFILNSIKDIELAWREAQRLDLTDNRMWAELVKAYKKINPMAVVPVMRGLVEDDLVKADARNYRVAVRRLKELRTICNKANQPEVAAIFVNELRSRYANRPRFLADLVNAGF